MPVDTAVFAPNESLYKCIICTDIKVRDCSCLFNATAICACQQEKAVWHEGACLLGVWRS